ncbi:MAG: type II toxin-antitoxin system HicB family antitoxin [Leptospirillum sp.]
MEYPVILEKDEEEGGFVATCPILRGCVSQGETEEEALENIRDAISLYLAGIEDLKRMGRYRTVDIPA